MAQVLIMEDEPNIALMLSVVLSDEGHNVRTVPNGQEGLESLQRDLPDIVFVDLNMPTMGGLIVIQSMHANPLWKDIPVIIMTGALLSPNFAADQAVQAVLCKPFDLWDVVREVAAIA